MTRLSRRFVLLGLPATLAACGPAEPVWAPQAQVDAVRYRHNGPPTITLFTMRNRGSGKGAHTGLMVSASQRVIFDPAGTFAGTGLVERNDVFYGATPLIERYYMTFHARETYFITRQDAVVSPQVAELALNLVINNGAVAKARCTRETSEILARLPGFGYVKSVLFPDALMRQFAEYPSVTTTDYYEDDSDDKKVAEAAWNAERRADLTN